MTDLLTSLTNLGLWLEFLVNRNNISWQVIILFTCELTTIMLILKCYSLKSCMPYVTWYEPRCSFFRFQRWRHVLRFCSETHQMLTTVKNSRNFNRENCVKKNPKKLRQYTFLDPRNRPELKQHNLQGKWWTWIFDFFHPEMSPILHFRPKVPRCTLINNLLWKMSNWNHETWFKLLITFLNFKRRSWISQ